MKIVQVAQPGSGDSKGVNSYTADAVVEEPMVLQNPSGALSGCYRSLDDCQSCQLRVQIACANFNSSARMCDTGTP